MTTLSRRLALAVVLVSAVGLSAQPPAPLPLPPGTPPQPPGAPAAEYVPTPHRAKEVLGARVMLAPSQAVGVVEDIVFSEAGQIEYLIVAEEGKLVTVPWEAATFDLKARTATLSIAPAAYRAIPTYTVAAYPAFYAPAYRTQVYKTYGLTPGEYRRAVRRDMRR